MRERNRLLKDMVRDAHWYGALERRWPRRARKFTAPQRGNLASDRGPEATETAFPTADLS